MSEYIIECEYDFDEGWIPGEQREEIVRCRDCRYYDQNDDPSEVYPDSYWCDKLTVYMPPNGFCPWGKDGMSNEHE